MSWIGIVRRQKKQSKHWNNFVFISFIIIVKPEEKICCFGLERLPQLKRKLVLCLLFLLLSLSSSHILNEIISLKQLNYLALEKFWNEKNIFSQIILIVVIDVLARTIPQILLKFTRFLALQQQHFGINSYFTNFSVVFFHFQSWISQSRELSYLKMPNVPLFCQCTEQSL